MKNQQRPTPRSISDGSTLEVHSIFRTIQGEGPHVGTPAIFIRLAGCNLQCPLCDTEYTANVQTMSIENIASHASIQAGVGSANPAYLIVITGGEPFRQNVTQLARLLVGSGFLVQFETNGMLPVQDADKFYDLVTKAPDWCQVVISPKTHTLDDRLSAVAVAYKYVIKHGDVAPDGLPISALDHPLPKNRVIARPPDDWKGHLFVQPADEKDEEANRLNMRAAVLSVMACGSRRLGLQMHKYAELE